MLVDDEQDVVLLWSLMIKWGFGEATEVLSAANGLDAITGALSHDPDLVLTGLHMPWPDGWEVTRRLRSRGYAGPIVVCSADPEPAARAREAGADAVLPKVVDGEELARVFERLLGRSPTERAWYQHPHVH